MEVSQALRAALTQSRNINLLKFIAIKKKKTEKPEKFRKKKKLDFSIQKISHAIADYDLLEKKKGQPGLAQWWWLLDPMGPLCVLGKLPSL